MENHSSSLNLKEIYDFLDKLAPFSICDSYDNVGILVGEKTHKVKKILIALDATVPVVEQAIDEGFDLVLCHHPVIFHPLKNLSPNNPAVKLSINNKCMLALHTNFDCADYGTTDIMVSLLGLKSEGILNVEFPQQNKGYGRICTLSESISPLSLAEKVKQAYNCQKVRLLSGKTDIKKIALASGGSGSEIKNAINYGCDAFIGGDIKHDQWIDALNYGITVIDAGHFPTENIFCAYMKKVLSEKFPQAEFVISKNSVEPFIFV